MDLRKNHEYIMDNLIGLEDKISFKCRGCGKCCKNRHDLLFTPMDLHRAGQYLGRTVKELLERYCEWYIGDSSRLPIVRVLPIPPNMACPFQRGQKCSLHNAKPTVCAAHPLARITVHESGLPQYVLDPSVKCGQKLDTPITVREFLGRNYCVEIDQAGMIWGEIMTVAGLRIIPMWQEMPDTKKSYYGLAMLNHIYLSLDINKPLLGEMRRVRDELPAFLDKVISLSEEDAFVRYSALASILGDYVV